MVAILFFETPCIIIAEIDTLSFPTFVYLRYHCN